MDMTIIYMYILLTSGTVISRWIAPGGSSLLRLILGCSKVTLLDPILVWYGRPIVVSGSASWNAQIRWVVASCDDNKKLKKFKFK